MRLLNTVKVLLEWIQLKYDMVTLFAQNNIQKTWTQKTQLKQRYRWKRKQNRESTEGYSSWKVGKRQCKFRKTGINNWSISKSQKGRNQASRRVRAPYWHATPVTNDPWKAFNSLKSSSVIGVHRIVKTGFNNQSTRKRLGDWTRCTEE